MDTLKAREPPLHMELSHSGPISTIKNLTAAVKDVFLHPTTDGQTVCIGIGLTAHPDHCCCSGDTVQWHT